METTIESIDTKYMTVVQLKAICKERNIGTGTQRAFASKEMLIKAIETGIMPEAIPFIPTEEAKKEASTIIQDTAVDYSNPIPEAKKPEFKADASKANQLAEILGSLVNVDLKDYVKKNDLTTLRKEVAEQLESFSIPVKRIEIVMPDTTKIDCGIQHEKFPLLIKLLSIRQHVFLTGQAGSGKTQGTEEAAKALNLPFYAVSVCAQTSVSTLLGYMGATGNYVRSLFRDCFEKGGVFLLDEVDNGNANVLNVLNAATSNGFCAFPDGMVKRHPDFVLVCAGNTFGNGADRQYIGRNQLDAAFLSRFAQVEWNIDENFELALCEDKEWTKYVQTIRANVEREKIRKVISPRASFNGARALKAGIPRKEVEANFLFAGMDSLTILKAKGNN